MKTKSRSSLAILAWVFLLAACAGAPKAVKESLNAMYPDARDLEWSQEDEGWEAEFEIGGQEFTALFTETGDWLETERAIHVDSLPDDVLVTMYSEYPEFDIREAEWVETPELKAFEVEIMNPGKEQAELEVMITPEGKILGMEDNEGAEEDDDD